MTNLSNKYYVYGLFGVNGELLYVGKGCNSRYLQHMNGCSSNKNVNRYFFNNNEDGSITHKFFYENLSESETFTLEEKLISEMNPCCNVTLRTDLTPKQKKVIGKKQNFKELSEEYYSLFCMLEHSENKDEIQQQMDAIKVMDKEFVEIVNTIGIEEIKATSFHKTKSKAKYNKLVGVSKASSSKSKAYRNLRVKEGMFYTYSSLRENIQNCYDACGVKAKAKATDIKLVYNVKRTTRQGVEGFVIGSRI